MQKTEQLKIAIGAGRHQTCDQVDSGHMAETADENCALPGNESDPSSPRHDWASVAMIDTCDATGAPAQM